MPNFFVPLSYCACAKPPVDCVKNPCVFAPSRLCVKSLRIDFCVLSASAVKSFFALLADYSCVAATTTCQIGGGGTEGGNRCNGGSSRANSHAVVPIRRFLGCFPPAISADKLNFVHFVNQKVSPTIQANPFA